MKAKRGRASIIVVLVFAVGAAVAGTGCVVRARAHPTVAPPAPRYVEVDYRPGYVWVQGRWVWGYGGWQWQRGYWVAERPGFYYTQGRWTRRGSRHVWVTGTWKRGRARRGVRVRDHRRVRRAPPRRGKARVWKRDHRVKKRKQRKKRKKRKDKRDEPRVRDHR